MIGLYITLGIALLICMLLSLRVKVIISYDRILRAYLRILFLKYDLIPYKEKKQSKKKKKKEKKSSLPREKSASNEKEDVSVAKKLYSIREVLIHTIEKFLGKLHFKIMKLSIVVSCENATLTAIAYGATTQGVSYLLATLDTISNVDVAKKSQISVRSDFISQKSSFEGKIVLYISVIHIIYVGWHFLKKYIKSKTKTED